MMPHKTLLLVEPDDGTLMELYESVRALPYDILLAQSAAEAVELARARRPNSILMYARLPHLEAYGILDALYDAGLRDVPIVMLNGVKGTPRPEEGATIVRVFRPCAPKVLRDAIRNVVEAP